MSLKYSLQEYRIGQLKNRWALYLHLVLLATENQTSRSNKKRKNNLTKNIPENQLRVLIVDDEERFRDAMAYHLTELYNAKVVTLASGYDAIDHFKEKNTYEIIFLDIKMPGIDGIETCRKLQSMNVACPIIMMSAYADGEKREQAEKLDVELLPKPFPDNMLAEIIHNISR